jgi:lycopene beta-cyclase
MMTYDYIVTGLGCAGMSFMYYLLDSPLKEKKVLLIDSSTKSENDRTWCYWSEKPLSIHPKNSPLVSWDKINIIKEDEKIQSDLGNLKYFHVKSSDFYSEVIKKIRNFPNVTFINDNITGLEEINGQKVLVRTKLSGEFYGAKVFNSIPFDQKTQSKSILYQTFVGWKIKCNGACFDEKAATLMHFPNPKSKETEFFYILPYNDSEALIEYTLYTKNKVDIEILEKKLSAYLKSNLQINHFEILFKEYGSIPMTTHKFEQKKVPNIISMGTLAGCTKPSTGYTFYDIQKHSKQILNELLEDNAEKKYDWNRKKRFSFYDNILLNIAVKWPSELPGIFKEMFEKNKAQQVLKFLNEESTFWDELKILGSLSYGIFIRSLLRYERH